MKKIHGFRLRFVGAIDYAFETQIERNKAMRQVTKAMKIAGMTRADFHVELKEGPRKGRGLRVIQG